MEVSNNETNSDLSSFTQEDSTLVSQSSSGQPKGITSKKKWKEKITYDSCIKSIYEDYAVQLDLNKSFKRCFHMSFLDTLIDEKKAEYDGTNKISKETKYQVGKGVDIKVDLVRHYGKIDFVTICGPGKHYPGSSYCM